MKKLFVIIAIVVVTIQVVSGQFTKFGGGLVYASSFYHNNETSSPDHRTPHFGIFVTGIYNLNLKLQVAPSFTYFYPHITKTSDVEYETKATVSEMMFDLNGHYVFNSLDRFEFYGLAGPDITLESIRFIETFSGGESKWGSNINAIGLNIGAGTYMKLTEQIDLNAEVKYIVSKYHQFMVNVGILINIDWLKKNENKGI